MTAAVRAREAAEPATVFELLPAFPVPLGMAGHIRYGGGAMTSDAVFIDYRTTFEPAPGE